METKNRINGSARCEKYNILNEKNHWIGYRIIQKKWCIKVYRRKRKRLKKAPRVSNLWG